MSLDRAETISTEDIKLIQDSGYFNEDYYLANYGEEINENETPLEHFLHKGWQEDKNPSQDFNVSDYLEMNPEVKQANVNPLLHYLLEGKQKGYVPSHFIEELEFVRQTGEFNEAYYLKNNANRVPEGEEALHHFMRVGWKEGCNPNGKFDVNYYLTSYKDIAATRFNPFFHYLRFGQFEYRFPNQIAEDIAEDIAIVSQSDLFDPVYYKEQAGAIDEDPLQHFLVTGWREGLNPSADFDIQKYLAKHAEDVGDMNPFLHYLRVGKGEGHYLSGFIEQLELVKETAAFNEAYYVEQNAELIPEGESPLHHFVRIGWRKGCNPTPYFDPIYYVKRYKDVEESGFHPFFHYLRFGVLEKRFPNQIAEGIADSLVEKSYKDSIKESDTQYVGHLEAVFPDAISGWIVNEVNPAQKIRLDVWLDGEFIQTTHVNLKRPDIQKVYPAASTAGFRFEAPDKWRVKAAWEFKLTIAETNETVLDTPKYMMSAFSLVRALNSIQKLLPDVDGLMQYYHEIKWLQQDNIAPLFDDLRANFHTSSTVLLDADPKSESLGTSKIVDVVMPIYEGYKETIECFNSVLNSQNADIKFRLIVIDDASPNDALKKYFEDLENHHSIILIKNDVNKGFVKSVNQGMKLSEIHDVVLLNSDTVVSDFWLDRLYSAAYSHTKVATVTPFSNNATAYSFPSANIDNDLPAGFTLKELNDLFYAINRGKVIEIPTAHGFCMYIKRQALEKMGFFNEELWGKGYGEENDFSIRARRSGYYNILATDVFIKHYGARSFEDKREIYVEENLNKIRSLYPDYLKEIELFQVEDPLIKLRNSVIKEIIASYSRTRTSKRVILFIAHTLGGGIKTSIEDLTRFLKTENQSVLLLTTNKASNLWSLAFSDNQQLTLRYRMDEDYKELIKDLKELKVWHIHYHHVLQFSSNLIWDLPKDLEVEFDITLHDYYFICPRVNLINEKNRYCFEPNYRGCNKCIRNNGAHKAFAANLKDFDWEIRNWRKHSEDLLRAARRVFVPSNDTCKRIRKYLKLDNIVVKPHPEDKIVPSGRGVVDSSDILNIAWLGQIGFHKGYSLLRECAEIASKKKLPLKFIVIGNTYHDEPLEAYDNIEITGIYERDNLGNIIQEKQCSVAALLSVWPETYSYTLSEAWKYGLLPIAYNFGAMAERITAHNAGILIDYPSSAKAICKLFVKIKETYPYDLLKKEIVLESYPSIAKDYYGFVGDV